MGIDRNNSENLSPVFLLSVISKNIRIQGLYQITDWIFHTNKQNIQSDKHLFLLVIIYDIINENTNTNKGNNEPKPP